jgi:phosphopantothenoylcysteine decarboxylase / phosphopantothenate---cysteine ligase
MQALHQRRVLLIVGGGIAAYKAPLIVRALQRQGAEVRCVLTDAAREFVTPLTLQSLTRAPVGTSLFDLTFESQIGHIELARWPDAVLIAPATANLISRMAHGLCDDLATTVLLATRAPIILAPAMNTQMLTHPATIEHIDRLRGWGHAVVSPDSGQLACLETGEGRQPDPDILVEAVIRRLMSGPLRGQRVLISAGPTRAYLDPVRFLSNPSTGKMGLAMARAASWLGAEVTLVAGPILPPSAALLSHIRRRVDVQTTDEMYAAVLGNLHHHDWLIMTAAVGDWRPSEQLTSKRKKASADERWTLDLVRTPDILSAAVKACADTPATARPRVIGFAAETHDLEHHARLKLNNKGCDAVLGNWVSAAQGDAFGADHNEVLLMTRDGWQARFGPDSKQAVALSLWAALIERLGTPTP